MMAILGRIRRWWWQVFGVVLFNIPFIGPNHYAWLPVPVLNCYACPLAQGACPIGTIQHFLVIGAIPLFTIGIVGIFAASAGRWYCGHLCPFGFFQDLLKKLSRISIRLPHWAGYGKYAALVLLVIIIPPIVNEPFFCTLCPAGSFEGGIPVVGGAWIEQTFGSPTIFSSSGAILGMVGWWFWFKLGILGLMIGAAIVIRRPFCRTACPLGAILGIFNRVSLLVHPPAEQLADGRDYRLKDCPVHIVHPDDVDSHNCIKCRACYRKTSDGPDRG